VNLISLKRWTKKELFQKEIRLLTKKFLQRPPLTNPFSQSLIFKNYQAESTSILTLNKELVKLTKTKVRKWPLNCHKELENHLNRQLWMYKKLKTKEKVNKNRKRLKQRPEWPEERAKINETSFLIPLNLIILFIWYKDIIYPKNESFLFTTSIA
jgi:hypothetical protein